MSLRSLLILTAFALASCGGGSPPAATPSAPPAPEDIAAGNTVPDESEPPSAEPSATPAPSAPVAASNDTGSLPTSARFQLGKHYNRLSPTQATSSPPDKVEVAEIFWYGCPHCYALEPSLKSWVASKPEYVSFVRVPVVWNDVAKMHARACYTAEALHKTGETHAALFREIHENHNPLDTEDKLRAFFGTFGVDAATFQSTYESSAVGTKMQRADELGRRYRVASVPTIVVNGKYTTDVGMAGGNEQLFALIGELAASEHSGK
jgi:protein dithiol oxidoreductase (disulfide-forming)